jgi:hypothetical protein
VHAPKLLAWICVMLVAVSGCRSTPTVYANTRGGRAAAEAMCEGVRSFTRSPLDADGLRRAWFLPLGSGGDWDLFYAPIVANPQDDSSAEFYQRVVQLTHYLLLRDYGEVLASCLTRRQGYQRVEKREDLETFHARFDDVSTRRRVVISSVNDRVVVLIAGPERRGDLAHSLELETGTE